MLKKLLLAAAIMALSLPHANAQLNPKPDDRISHYLGIQVNPLFKQIINFGNSPAVDNPFLLKYGLRFNESQQEILFGVGYEYQQSSDRDGLKSDFSDLSMRIGYSKKYRVGKRFEVGLGGDFVVNAMNRQTINVFVAGDSTITTTKTMEIGYGLGPQLTLGYYITNRIRIGTEATYYLMSGTTSNNVQVKNYRQDFNGQIIETIITDDQETSSMNFNLQLPVALFLTIVF